MQGFEWVAVGVLLLKAEGSSWKRSPQPPPSSDCVFTPRWRLWTRLLHKVFLLFTLDVSVSVCLFPPHTSCSSRVVMNSFELKSASNQNIHCWSICKFFYNIYFRRSRTQTWTSKKEKLVVFRKTVFCSYWNLGEPFYLIIIWATHRKSWTKVTVSFNKSWFIWLFRQRSSFLGGGTDLLLSQFIAYLIIDNVIRSEFRGWVERTCSILKIPNCLLSILENHWARPRSVKGCLVAIYPKFLDTHRSARLV